ncbi:polysaccharide biosynthesis tyrosine autokinase [Paraburkholderia sp. Tr-20389]|uniref:polysaccharide biosynthesis tyrosine autokinase n=1 Tax=Paraburkholderia sp. Tr-20389 TaxID=2703903 RepID=UPI00197D7848|nr:polysaccharide biosynthesis tyrosine autokinase [Paraburkholderia sp. Tr-20389]MBN3756905.1 polysaccharide biosynthesis tyrosine autokinase [Paraburkholderia sp. Tr-20389]
MNEETLRTRNSNDRDDDGSSDVVAILDILLETKWTILVIVSAFLLLGVSYALLAKPVYQADIMAQVEGTPDTAPADGLLGDVSSLFDIKSSAAAETQVLASRLVVSRAVDKLHLYISAKPLRFPIIGSWVARHNNGLTDPGVFGIGGYVWGQESIDVAVFNVPHEIEGDAFKLTLLDPKHYRISGDDLQKSAEGTIGSIERFDSVSGPVELLVSSVTARTGAAFRLVRNSRLQTIEDLQDHLDVQEKVKQSDVIVASLQDTDPLWLADVLNEIGSQYVQQNVERKSEAAAQSLDFLKRQLPQLKAQLSESETMLTKFQNERGTVDLSEEAKQALLQNADAQTRLLELQQKRAELLTHFTRDNPNVVSVDRQIESLSSYRDSAHAQIRRLPDLQRESVGLLLDVKVNTDMYAALLNNMQQLQLVRAGKVGNIRLVDTAEIEEVPVKPKKVLVIIASLMFGLLFSTGWSISRWYLFKGITDPSEIERRLGLSVYATVPLSSHQVLLSNKSERNGAAGELLALAFPDDPAIESLRSLRTALQFAMLEAKNNLVLIAGSAPGVGKSFVSANLSAVLATAGKRVLLIDGDIRKGRLNEYLGYSREGGFSDAISGSISLEDAIHCGVVPGLDFISTGNRPTNPSELLLNSRVDGLIKELSARYDIVIIDSPPVLAVSDACTLAALAGTIFLVAFSGATKLGEISESDKRLAQNGIKLNGVVFNGINPKLGLYGYGSKYGSYRYVAYEYGPERDA